MNSAVYRVVALFIDKKIEAQVDEVVCSQLLEVINLGLSEPRFSDFFFCTIERDCRVLSLRIYLGDSCDSDCCLVSDLLKMKAVALGLLVSGGQVASSSG